MLRDVFYYGNKPNVHPREKFATDLADARRQATTEHFWIINEFCNYKNFEWDFDFEFLPDEDVWAEDHNNVWPSQHQKDSGTWLCPKVNSDIIIYRADVDVVQRKNIKTNNWVEYDNVDPIKFDFSWHPDPTDPPYIYVWGNQWYSGKVKPTVEYHVTGATEVKHMDSIAYVMPDPNKFEILDNIDASSFDFSWRPNPAAPPYIYVWGNQWNIVEDRISIQYTIPGATEYKYMQNKVTRNPCKDNWIIPSNIDTSDFDFSWEPSPKDPPFIYQFGTQWQKTGGPKYVIEGATEIKYIVVQQAKALPTVENWTVPDNIDVSGFDFSWHPDELDPPYTYYFSTQWALTGGPVYHVEGATEKKYIEFPSAVALASKTNWEVPDNIDATDFDFSWHPYADDDPFIYEFGTQWQKNGGPKYITPGVEKDTPIKYIDTRILKSKRLPDQSNFHVLHDYEVDTSTFDFSWHPDNTEDPYIYVFGNQYYPAEKMPTMEYRVEGATQYKYINNVKVNLKPNKKNWKINVAIDESKWDFAWVPDPGDPPYIYVWGNQWNPAEIESTIEYHVYGATEIKYMNNCIAYAIPDMTKWEILWPIEEDKFDFSWRPSPKDPAYIYCFGNNLYPSNIMSTVEYKVDGATDFKYMDTQLASLAQDRKNWIIPSDVDTTGFDFSWKPSPKDPPYIYEFATQWQRNGGPRYYVPGAKEIKYMDIQKVRHLKNTMFWEVPENLDISGFDFSWHPDNTEEPYIYQFGTQWALTGGPKYITPDAKEIKYIDFPVAKAQPTKTNWVVPSYIDKESFDFSWHPYADDDPFIYEFGTQWQKNGGPRYITPGVDPASPIKYIDTRILKSKRLPDQTNFHVLHDYAVDTNTFDFSWHPDNTEEPYIYVFGNQYYSAEKMPTMEYRVSGATQYKYINHLKIHLKANKKNWKINIPIDESTWDFSWVPDPGDPPFIYVWGNQWNPSELESTIEYVVPGATEIKYMNDKIATVLPNKTNWEIQSPIIEDKFDFSWRPNPTDPAYIYCFGNNLYPSNVMSTVEYKVPGATDFKYMDNLVATLAPDRTNWIVPNNVDITGFDFSWKPSPKDPSYIYEFATQWQKTGGPRYFVPGAKEIKYMDIQKVRRLVSRTYWEVPESLDISEFDFSWHPDSTEEPYIYQFGTQWALTGGPKYVSPDAKEIKYIDFPIAKAAPNRVNWIIPDNIDADSFDFSWHPYVEDQPYVYVFGTQHQKTGGPKYIAPGADDTSFVKYIDTRILKSKALPTHKHWEVVGDIQIQSFDYSWHPDDTEQPYIYVFGNNLYPAEIMPTIRYIVPGAKQVKYIHDVVAELAPSMNNWDIPIDIDSASFDFSWLPNPNDPPYIYQFGTQWQKTGGPRYIVPGATEVKYVDTIKAKRLQNISNFTVLNDYKIKDFDWSWHPDDTEEPYIYVFGNNQYPAEIMPTIQYATPDAKQTKFVTELKATLDIDMKCWDVPNNVDVSNFDFSWHPNPLDPSFIYEFGTQHQKTGGPRYITLGATETKYVDTFKSKRFSNAGDSCWNTLIPISEFDWSWHPDSTEEPYIYVFGNQWNSAEIEPTVEYRVEGATERKYINDIKAKVLPVLDNWKVLIPIDSFDYSWRPDPGSPPYIYVFGNQWNDAMTEPTLEYHVPGATDKKYITDIIATVSASTENWKTIIPVDSFDYSWRPNPHSPPYIYVFGNQWNPAELEATVEYHVSGATDRAYIGEFSAKVAPYTEGWEVIEDITDFDYSWRPNPTDPDYIYVFGNTQYPGNIMPTIKLRRGNATQEKFIDEVVAKLAPKPELFKKFKTIKSFDYTWRPNPKDPAYTYVFGNQWYPSEKDSTIEFHVEGATQKKYINNIVATIGPNSANWEIPEGCNTKNFDFSWYPDPGAPAYIYQFGTLLDPKDGPRYITPGNDGSIVNLERIETEEETELVFFQKYVIKTTLEDLINEHPTEMFWAMRESIDYTNFDFNWRPSIEQAQYLHAFGSADSELTQTYLVNAPMYLKGYKEINWVENKKLDDASLFEMFKKPDMFFVDRSNKESSERFTRLKERFPEIQKTRYLNSWVDTINRCINRSSSDLCWILNSELDYTDFNFEYYPNPWQMKMVHVFGTQWSHWGTTFMVNRETFPADTKYIKIIEHLSNLNFVKDRKAIATNVLYDIVYIDHGNMTDTNDKFVVKYEDSYLKTFKNLLSKLPEKKEHFIWVCSSVCNYDGFDFTYICDPFAREHLHVFPSDKQKFGDTFLVNVNKLRELVSNMTILEEYGKINYNQHQKAKRLSAPIITTEYDTHVASVMTDFDFPYAVFVTEDNKDIKVIDEEPMNLWAQEKKNIIVTSTGGTRIIVPKEAKNFVETQLYDYPYIKKLDKLAKSKPLDIVYLSNGEKLADENFEHLQYLTKDLENRVVRVDGVNGRVAAYHAAAEASNTPWMFTVFAKLKVSPKFDFNWQPDRLQMPKHYMFNAKNPLNGLVYGHQGIIAYNKNLTLLNQGAGLDFTLDDPHETINVLSGVANFNTDAYSTWRTAFREVIKLLLDKSDISKQRLEVWLTKAEGDFSVDCLNGANDAVQYFDEVNGEFNKLKLSYEWQWLKEKYESKYK